MSATVADPLAARAWRLAAGIGALYAGAGTAWIFLSDALVSSLAPDAAWLAAAQRYKGLFYILATSIGLVLLVRAGYRRLFAAAQERDQARATLQAGLERRVAERTAELERVNVELEAFTRTAAHDLKSPLNAMAGYAELLRRQHGAVLGAEGLRMVGQIGRSAQHMATLVNDLLALSRATSGELAVAEVDLAALAREIVAELHQQQPDRVVEFEAPPQLLLRCDPGLARSLLANLLGNAWKFSSRRERATIRLSAADTPQGVEVRVADNGAGFDASDKGRLFQPFQRFHAAADYAGTGIGLVTCQRIVQRHGGAIRVESAPGQGAAFSFTLGPVAAAPAAACP